ncbi:hypothetical protein KIPB_006250, partial [Kipferlia bialata]|eukprot:g6250.t1
MSETHRLDATLSKLEEEAAVVHREELRVTGEVAEAEEALADAEAALAQDDQRITELLRVIRLSESGAAAQLDLSKTLNPPAYTHTHTHSHPPTGLGLGTVFTHPVAPSVAALNSGARDQIASLRKGRLHQANISSRLIGDSIASLGKECTGLFRECDR